MIGRQTRPVKRTHQYIRIFRTEGVVHQAELRSRFGVGLPGGIGKRRRQTPAIAQFHIHDRVQIVRPVVLGRIVFAAVDFGEPTASRAQRIADKTVYATDRPAEKNLGPHRIAISKMKQLFVRQA